MTRSSQARVSARGAVKTVLVVEDDPAIADVLLTNLRLEGYETVHAGSLTAARKALTECRPSLILLDLNLPEGNGKGLELCREVRAEHPSVPVMILTANVEEDSAVKGLTLGATDYLRKPFRRRELLALVKNRLAPTSGKYQVGSLVADQDSRKLSFDGIDIPLTPNEFDILSLLMSKRGDVVTRENILQLVDPEATIDDNSVSTYLSRIRSKMEKAGVKGVKIVPCYGQGYRLEALGLRDKP